MTPAAATRIPFRHRVTRGSDGVDDAGAIDPQDQRQHRPAGALVAGAHAHIEHAIDGRGMNPDAEFAVAGHGIGHGLVDENVRRTILMDHDRFHAETFRKSE